MSKKIGDITTIIKDYVNDTTITADQHAIDAVNFLSNVFPLKKIDSTKTTVSGQNYIAYPTGCITVNRVTINGIEIPKAEDLDHLEVSEDNDVQRWYAYNGMIMFTKNFSVTAQAVKIWYDGSYIVPASATDTDVPDEMMELVYVGGTFRYFRKMVSASVTAREKYPDATPDEMIKVRDQWKKEVDELISDIKRNR
jgi:hypothetical protein